MEFFIFELFYINLLYSSCTLVYSTYRLIFLKVPLRSGRSQEIVDTNRSPVAVPWGLIHHEYTLYSHINYQSTNTKSNTVHKVRG